MRGRIAALAAALTAVLLGASGASGASGAGVSGAQAATAAAAQADIVSTASVTSITSSSALLNGLAYPSLPGSVWVFQYGTTTSYAQRTSPEPLGNGLSAVDARATGLQPGTLYHYRLAVLNNALIVAASPDATFTTPALPPAEQPPYGKPKLVSRQVPVVGRRAYVSFSCRGVRGAHCPALVAIAVKQRVAGRPVTTACASGQDLALAAAVRPLQLPVRKACVAALRAAASHHLGAELDALFAGRARVMRVAVTLVLKRA